ncbi:MAG: GDSL-type esterase/lipase family protein [Ferruginibacter sp.]
MTTYSLLALGDSYTIGEQVPLAESFPYQTVQILRKADVRNDKKAVGRQHLFAAPEIIAKTGWTTDELTAAIGQKIFLPQYDIVTLLIGVNNQYRGKPADEFKKEFEILLQMAIQFAGGLEHNVYVISIPDWGITPFANDRESEKISGEIDRFNSICELAASTFKTHYINITTDQRIDNTHAGFIATDGLHPSGKEYRKWAIKLSDIILANLQ